jgi:hypothetical protein
MPPVLTVRAFAEMLELPLYEQVRILEGQKYPRQAPASYRVPYYRPALQAIRDFYTSGGQAQVLLDAIVNLRASGLPPSRIENNVRVITDFQRTRQARRQLMPRPGRRIRTDFSGVELKLTPDFVGAEGQAQKIIFYNFRQARLTSNVARATLELAAWALRHAGGDADPANLECIDLADRGRVHRIRQIRPQTIRRAQQNARAIRQIWDGL